jgi:hypothetical protein
MGDIGGHVIALEGLEMAVAACARGSHRRSTTSIAR